MGRKKKNDNDKAKHINAMLYDEDIKTLEKLAKDLGMTRQEVIRYLIRNAKQSDTIVKNIAYLAYEDYMKKMEDIWSTSHNGQNVKEISEDFEARFKYAKYKEAERKAIQKAKEKALEADQDTTTMQSGLTVAETRKIAKELMQQENSLPI